MDLQKIKDIAFETMANKCNPNSGDKSEKYLHGERVAKLALKLRRYLYPDDSSHDNIITVSAWFHDIMNGVENHNIVGADRAREILAPYCSEYELNTIYEIISVHDDRNSDRNYSKYVKLHQDADLLDHYGTFELWRCFIYAVPNQESIIETLNWMKDKRPSYYEEYRNQLNFDVCKKIYDEKVDFLNKFTERFNVECSGDIWNEECLLI